MSRPAPEVQRQFDEWLRRGRTSGSLAPLVAYLQHRVDDTMQKLVDTPDLNRLPRLQGAASELQDLITTLTKE